MHLVGQLSNPSPRLQPILDLPASRVKTLSVQAQSRQPGDVSAMVPSSEQSSRHWEWPIARVASRRSRWRWRTCSAVPCPRTRSTGACQPASWDRRLDSSASRAAATGSDVLRETPPNDSVLSLL
jgi:hypothetical protein